MTYMNGWSWFVYSVLFFLIGGFALIFIHPLVALVIAILWAYGIVKYIVMYLNGVPIEYEEGEEEYFSTEDIMCAKVGEWISRK